MSTPVADPGAARARTSLAWTRTALGLLGNGVLVLVRHERAFPLGVAVALATAFVVTAALALFHGHRRGRAARVQLAETHLPTAAVWKLGLCVLSLCVVTLGSLAARW